MKRQAKPIPAGFHSVTPHITVRNAAAAIDFCKQAFGAVELMRHTDPDGRIRHAQVRIGDSPLMLSDEFEENSFSRSVQSFGGSPMSVFLYVDDADAVAQSAVAAGAKWLMEMSDQEFGRTGGVQDPSGLVWWITTP